jgi:hypothetical protein
MHTYGEKPNDVDLLNEKVDRLAKVRGMQGRIQNLPDCPLKDEISKEIAALLEGDSLVARLFEAEQQVILLKSELELASANLPSLDDHDYSVSDPRAPVDKVVFVKILFWSLFVAWISFNLGKAVGVGS